MTVECPACGQRMEVLSRLTPCPNCGQLVSATFQTPLPPRPQPAPLVSSEEVRRAERPILLIRLGPESFFKRLRKKLHWGDLSDRTRK